METLPWFAASRNNYKIITAQRRAANSIAVSSMAVPVQFFLRFYFPKYERLNIKQKSQSCNQCSCCKQWYDWKIELIIWNADYVYQLLFCALIKCSLAVKIIIWNIIISEMIAVKESCQKIERVRFWRVIRQLKIVGEQLYTILLMNEFDHRISALLKQQWQRLA